MKCQRCGEANPAEIHTCTPKQEKLMHDAVTYGMAVSKDGQRIDPASIYKESEQECRDDGRCQYAIDHGAEGLGRCPKGECCMPKAQPEQEPVAWKDAPSKIYLQVCEESNCDQPFDSHIEISWCQDKINDSDISYVRADIATPQREWQGLTDEEIDELAEANLDFNWKDGVEDFARAIEAKLKEKNT